ncbi:MAG: uncharacterized protein JWM16_6318 [Verrucomicrobiales bacterium]|nr:uncharacterized protein [Verrucomicrobiales bacterium]
MCKTPLRLEQEVFEAEATVDEAAEWAKALLHRAYYGPGDTLEAATYRAEQKYGVPAQTFWALRYRKPKAILANIYLTLKAAYEAECGRQEARLRHELELVKALPVTPARQALVADAEAALGQAESRTGTAG